MTTTTSTAKPTNLPAFELFAIEEKPADRAAAAKQGKVLAENATERTWTKVGVAFATKTGSLTVLIGPRGDPKQKRFLLCATTALDADDSDSRLPVGELFELTEGQSIDFKKDKAGVAWLNSDGSYNLVMGDRGDLDQPRYNLRRPQVSKEDTLAARVKELEAKVKELETALAAATQPKQEAVPAMPATPTQETKPKTVRRKQPVTAAAAA